MPSLIAFGRRWNIASDDFVFPAISEAFFRFIWVLVTCIVVALNNPLKCRSLDFIISMLVLISLNLLTILLCITIARISSRGAILQPFSRRHISTLLHIRLPVYIIELLCTIYSTIIAFVSGEFCHLTLLFRLTVILQWILLFAVLFGVAVVFNPSGKSRLSNHYASDSEFNSYLRCLKLFSCLDRRGEQTIRSALNDISTMIASFFDDVDLVPSDILSGLILLVHSSELPTTDLASSSDESMIPEWMTIENAKKTFNFALAIYGWPTYMLGNCNCTACLELCRKSQCHKTNSRMNITTVEGDNCCLCNLTACSLMLDYSSCSIRYISFRNHLYEVPFAVIADFESHSVVITIRGSASITDLITDLSLDDEALISDLYPPNNLPNLNSNTLTSEPEIRVHTGMLRSARYILFALREQRIFEEMDEIMPGYITVLCGHSLGAGVATILALLLKNEREVRCFAYSPPGCIIDENGLAATKNNVFSIVLGDDIIPRLSFQTLNDLKLRIIDSLIGCENAKYKILIKGCFRLFMYSSSSSWLNDDAVENDFNIINSADDRLSLVFNRPLTSYEYGGVDNSDRPMYHRRNRIKLFPAGRLLFLRVINNRCFVNWIEQSDLNEIKLSSTMVLDHWPFYLQKVLNMDLNNINSQLLSNTDSQ